MAVRHLDVKHHQQDTNYYCGAACAQMVLETIGAGMLDQEISTRTITATARRTRLLRPESWCSTTTMPWRIWRTRSDEFWSWPAPKST